MTLSELQSIEDLTVKLKHQAKNVSIGSSVHVRKTNHRHESILLTIAMQQDQKQPYKVLFGFLGVIDMD
jgi:hypothetical protein